MDRIEQVIPYRAGGESEQVVWIDLSAISQRVPAKTSRSGAPGAVGDALPMVGH